MQQGGGLLNRSRPPRPRFPGTRTLIGAAVPQRCCISVRMAEAIIWRPLSSSSASF